MDCTYLNDELSGDICCPVCGISEALNTFWPHDLRGLPQIVSFQMRTTESRKYNRCKFACPQTADTSLTAVLMQLTLIQKQLHTDLQFVLASFLR